MSINVKNVEAERLLAELKQRTGKGTTDLLLDLFKREKQRLELEADAKVAKAISDMRRLQESWAARPLVDPRSAEEILAYDENGLPT